jgi:hypothetical protein
MKVAGNLIIHFTEFPLPFLVWAEKLKANKMWIGPVSIIDIHPNLRKAIKDDGFRAANGKKR